MYTLKCFFSIVDVDPNGMMFSAMLRGLPAPTEACESAAPQKLPAVTWNSKLKDGGELIGEVGKGW